MPYAPQGSGTPPDAKVSERLGDLVELQKASSSRFWRTIALIVAFATIVIAVGAIFEIISYFRG